MKNENYSLETAHLPSPADMEKWNNGGREADKREREKLKRVRERWDQAERLKKLYHENFQTKSLATQTTSGGKMHGLWESKRSLAMRRMRLEAPH